MSVEDAMGLNGRPTWYEWLMLIIFVGIMLAGLLRIAANNAKEQQVYYNCAAQYPDGFCLMTNDTWKTIDGLGCYDAKMLNNPLFKNDSNRELFQCYR